jgi:hypothetical protein
MQGKFPLLNLPDIEPRISEDEENLLIFDTIRKAFVVLTPEEWVRQHFIGLLVNHLQYPKSMIKIEKQLKYIQRKKRTDIEVMTSEGTCFLIVECKAPEVKLDKSTLTQISVYNAIKKSPYVAISNGMKHFVWRFHENENRYEALHQFPNYR